MTLHPVSRRRLLGGLVAGLSAVLCPRSPRAAASPPPAPTDTRPPSPPTSFTSYHYHSGINDVTVYTYDGNCPFVNPLL